LDLHKKGFTLLRHREDNVQWSRLTCQNPMIGYHGFTCLKFLHMGFDVSMVKWIIHYVTIVSCVVLINGARSPFFLPGRGLRRGFPLPSYLFLLVVDGLSRALDEEK